MSNRYYEAVSLIAEEVIENCGLNKHYWMEEIEKRIDGSYFLDTYPGNEICIKETQNEPDEDEISELINPSCDWRKIRSFACYLAMRQDVYDRCLDLQDDYFECEDCGNVFEEEDNKYENICFNCLNKNVCNQE